MNGQEGYEYPPKNGQNGAPADKKCPAAENAVVHEWFLSVDDIINSFLENRLIFLQKLNSNKAINLSTATTILLITFGKKPAHAGGDTKNMGLSLKIINFIFLFFVVLLPCQF